MRSLDVTISGWLFEYWLATTDELGRLVPEEPEQRTSDAAMVRWELVADTAARAIRIARKLVGETRSPQCASTWNITAAIPTPTRLKNEEARIVSTLFTSEAAISDFGSTQVTNGRHRMYYSWKAGATFLPIRSAAVSAWTDSLFGDPSHSDLRYQTWDCAGLHRFKGVCNVKQSEPGADQEFIDALADAIDIAEEFLTDVAADAFQYDPRPRRLRPE